MKIAIYPFSADPITYGHIDIIERAAHTFDRVIAAIGINPTKEYLFTKEERLQMATKALQHLPNVVVDTYDGLLADFARTAGTNVIIRGVRNTNDFNYEWMIYQINESIDDKMETFFMPCKKNKESISSSKAKEVWQNKGDLSSLVPIPVIEMFNNRIV
jgi:pantetheine-phosphate adenylyltransferase